MRSFDFVIRQSHIDAGIKGHKGGCPAALAMKDYEGSKCPNVDVDKGTISVSLGGDRFKWNAETSIETARCLHWAAKFDNDQNTIAFGFFQLPFSEASVKVAGTPKQSPKALAETRMRNLTLKSDPKRNCLRGKWRNQ